MTRIALCATVSALVAASVLAKDSDASGRQATDVQQRLASAQGTNDQASKVAGNLGTIASYLQNHPEMVIDFTHVSGEYCLNTWKAGGAHMSHFAVDPSKTQEDVIEFVKADSLSNAAVDVSGLPRMPDTLGAMEPGNWYYKPAGAFEPHHGKEMGPALLIRASNIE